MNESGVVNTKFFSFKSRVLIAKFLIRPDLQHRSSSLHKLLFYSKRSRTGNVPTYPGLNEKPYKISTIGAYV
jgi:hypothetical protein